MVNTPATAEVNRPPQSPKPGRHRSRTATPILLVILNLAVFHPVRDFEFLSFDDDDYVIANCDVQGGINGDGIIWAFSSTAHANWHPLIWMSLMLDIELFGTGAAAFHLTNLRIHTANSIRCMAQRLRCRAVCHPSVTC